MEGCRCNRLEIGQFLGFSYSEEAPAALSRSAGAIEDEKGDRNGSSRVYALMYPRCRDGNPG
jgi:hypothetical protein